MRRPDAPAASIVDLSWLSALRPDERERSALHFREVELAPGATLNFSREEPPRAGLVLEGRVVLTRAELPGLPPVQIHLGPGDRWGELTLFAKIPTGVELSATEASRVAILDDAGFRALGEEFPVLWLTVAARLSRELKWKNDLLREIQELDAQRVDGAQLELFLESRRRRVARRRTGVARNATRALFRHVIADPGREPAFWILVGFLGAIAVSRAVVASILRLNLQQQLFALHASGGANPIHTHHFNYGFALMIATSLVGFVPGTRRYLRPLAFVFGCGLGLVFDEFALIWNLNPDYYQSLSYEAQAVLALALAQVVWFRRFYATLFARWQQR